MFENRTIEVGQMDFGHYRCLKIIGVASGLSYFLSWKCIMVSTFIYSAPTMGETDDLKGCIMLLFANNASACNTFSC